MTAWLRLELDAPVERLAALDEEVDAVWRGPDTIRRIRSYMQALRPPPER